MTKGFTMSKEGLQKMFSGHLSLELANDISWSEFPEFAAEIVSKFGAKIIGKSEGVEMRIWELSFGDVPLRLTYEDFPEQVSLESSSDAGDDKLRQIEGQLSKQISRWQIGAVIRNDYDYREND
jgi:Protein of unknown function (DUF3630)